MEKALLILDIDETLIHGTSKKMPLEETCIVYKYYIYSRPFLEHFLDTTSKHYHLALWSSASDDYVEQVVANTILKDYNFKFIWGRSKATFRRNYEFDEARIYGSLDHYHYVKPLKKVKKLGFSLERILIIDDSPHKSKLNYGNAIYPTEFKGKKDDIELKLLAKYLLKIKDHPNFRTLEKRGWRSSIIDDL